MDLIDEVGLGWLLTALLVTWWLRARTVFCAARADYYHFFEASQPDKPMQAN